MKTSLLLLAFGKFLLIVNYAAAANTFNNNDISIAYMLNSTSEVVDLAIQNNNKNAAISIFVHTDIIERNAYVHDAIAQFLRQKHTVGLLIDAEISEESLKKVLTACKNEQNFTPKFAITQTDAPSEQLVQTVKKHNLTLIVAAGKKKFLVEGEWKDVAIYKGHEDSSKQIVFPFAEIPQDTHEEQKRFTAALKTQGYNVKKLSNANRNLAEGSKKVRKLKFLHMNSPNEENEFPVLYDITLVTQKVQQDQLQSQKNQENDQKGVVQNAGLIMISFPKETINGTAVSSQVITVPIAKAARLEDSDEQQSQESMDDETPKLLLSTISSVPTSTITRTTTVTITSIIVVPGGEERTISITATKFFQATLGMPTSMPKTTLFSPVVIPEGLSTIGLLTSLKQPLSMLTVLPTMTLQPASYTTTFNSAYTATFSESITETVHKTPEISATRTMGGIGGGHRGHTPGHEAPTSINNKSGAHGGRSASGEHRMPRKGRNESLGAIGAQPGSPHTTVPVESIAHKKRHKNAASKRSMLSNELCFLLAAIIWFMF